MINLINGVSVRCCICSGSGPIIRIDPSKYHINDYIHPEHLNILHIKQVHKEAENAAIKEGFIAINAIQDNLDEEEHNMAEQHPDANIINNATQLKHLCPKCLDGLAIHIKQRKTK